MSQIKYKKEQKIATLTVDRPEALNALNRTVIDNMDQYIGQIAEDEDLRCLILYSKDNFAAGADVKSMVHCDAKDARSFLFSPTYNKIEQLAIPVIAAIEGYALGGGMELALTADIRIAGESAKMGFPEVTLGIMPGAGGTIRTPRLIGEAWAKELIFSGRIIEAGEAKTIGLVNHITKDADVLAEALKLAGQIARRAPIAVSAAKRTIRDGIEEPNIEKGVALEADRWAQLFTTEDQKEGMHAFIEKRKPNFKNK